MFFFSIVSLAIAWAVYSLSKTISKQYKILVEHQELIEKLREELNELRKRLYTTENQLVRMTRE